MFVKKTRSKNFIYLSLVKSYRENGQVKHRTVAKLGRLDELKKNDQLSRIVATLAEASNESLPLPKIEEIARLNWGAAKIFRQIWNQFQMDDILDSLFARTKIEFDYKETIFLEVVSRLMKPSSKYQVYQGQGKFLGIDQISLQHIYRILDYLAAFQPELEKMLFLKNAKDFGLEVDVVFYDVTTLYFESVKPDSLKDFGYSKDGKYKEVQVVVGMCVDREGRPISCGIFPGNTFESKTLEDTLEKLKERFQIRQVIIVADRGINLKLNLKKIKEKGYDYIVGSRIKGLKKAVKQDILDIDQYKPAPGENGEDLKYRILDYDNIVIEEVNGKKKKTVPKERIFCTWSKKRAEKDRKDRERMIKKAKKIIDEGIPLESKRGAKRYVKKENENQKSGNIDLDLEKIVDDEKWDGFYGVQVSKEDVDIGTVVSSYTRLWKMEESFRVMKHSLEIRPIYLSSPVRIIGHIVLCYIALVIHRKLEIELEKRGLCHTVERIRQAIDELEASVILIDDKPFMMRSNHSRFAREIMKIVKVKPPVNLAVPEKFFT